MREWLDIWTNWSDPIGRSEPSAPAEAELPDSPLGDAATDDIGVVIIGRNEGRRLVRALDSVAGLAGRVVYVDSGSQDGSVESARAKGVEVVELDLSEPFTAARARNAGFDRLMQILPDVRFVQFVDGDCEIADGWFARAHQTMHQRPEAAIVCGQLSERNPEASIYNRLLDIEWEAPVGDVAECGGVAMIRAKAFRQLGGFNAELIAGEEPELCLRLRLHGWRIVRIDAEMATHDAAMTSFGQWWRRAVRAGYTYAQGVHLHGGQRFRLRQATSTAIWAVVIPVLALAAAWATQGASLWILALYPIQFVRIGIGQIRAARPIGVAAAYAACILPAKFAELTGLVRFAITHVTRGKPRLIEYKSADLSSAKESL